MISLNARACVVTGNAPRMTEQHCHRDCALVATVAVMEHAVGPYSRTLRKQQGEVEKPLRTEPLGVGVLQVGDAHGFDRA